MFWGQKKGWYGKKLAMRIDALNNGDLSNISWIFCAFLKKNAALKKAAAFALDSTLGAFSFDEIIRVDQQMRHTTSMEWSMNWRKLHIESFFTSQMSMPERRSVIVFSSFHPNGYLRQQAIELMETYEMTLPFIILRLNDWVAQVRQAAAIALEKRLVDPAPGEMFAAIPFADKISRGGRSAHGVTLQQFTEALLRPACKQDLALGLRSRDIRIRRFSVNALMSAFCPNIPQILEQLALEPDPLLRLTIYRKLMQLRQDMLVPSQILLRDRFPRNRIHAIQYLYEHNPTVLLPYITNFLIDKNAGVREIARKITQNEMPDFNFREFYLNRLPQNTGVAILGLGETGRPSDAIALENYLHDKSIAIVSAAMISLMRLNSSQYLPAVVDMLADQRAGVVKTAQRLILKYKIFQYERILDIFWSTPYGDTKRKCVTLLFTAGKWERLLYMLVVLSCDSKELDALVLQNIQRWLFCFNRSYAPIGEGQKARLTALLSRLEGQLPSSMKRELLFCLN